MDRKWLRKLTIIMFTAGFCAIAAGCNNQTKESNKTSNTEGITTNDTAENTVVLKLAHAHDKASVYQIAAEAAAKYAEETSKGTLKIEVYSDSSLGNEPELIEGLKMGTADLAMIAPGNMNEYCSTLKLFLMPYLFENDEHVAKIMNSEVKREILDAVENDLDIKAYTIGEAGFRQTMNNIRPINNIQDMKGISIRVPNWPGVIKAFETWGAIPQVIAYTEAYTSLSSGVIQGIENPLSVLTADHFYEVCKYLTMTNHVYDCSFYCGSKSAYDKLSDNQKKILEDALEVASITSYKFVAEENETYLKTMADNGVLINEIKDTGEFSDSIQFIYDDFSKDVSPELVQKIIDLKK